MIKRLAVLYTEPAAYMRSCLKEFIVCSKGSLLTVEYEPSKDAPFRTSPFEGLGQSHKRKDFQSAEDLVDVISAFDAECVFVSGWVDSLYLKACKILKRKGVLVVAGADTPYKGTLRQLVAGQLSKYYLKPAIDVLWVPGESQKKLANLLGFKGERCWTGLYCCNWDQFKKESGSITDKEPSFIFVGRYVPEKGLDVLLKAYSVYRDKSQNPWPLYCAGNGPLKERLINLPGIVDLGFVQPEDLGKVITSKSVFILPSLYEPWGVVLQEAAVANLALISSDAVGASVHLVRDFHNGFRFCSGDSFELANRMLYLSQLDKEELGKFCENSFEMSRLYTPSNWVQTLVAGFETLHL